MSLLTDENPLKLFFQGFFFFPCKHLHKFFFVFFPKMPCSFTVVFIYQGWPLLGSSFSPDIRPITSANYRTTILQNENS